MEFKISSKKDNPMLDRHEIMAEILFQGSIPSREEVIKQIAKKENTEESLVVIKKIDAVAGYGKATVAAFAYKNAEALKKIEYAYMTSRGKKKEAGADAPKAEAKKEA